MTGGGEHRGGGGPPDDDDAPIYPRERIEDERWRCRIPPPADWTNRLVNGAFSFPGGGGRTSPPMTGGAAESRCREGGAPERMGGRWQRDTMGGYLGGSATAHPRRPSTVSPVWRVVRCEAAAGVAKATPAIERTNLPTNYFQPKSLTAKLALRFNVFVRIQIER